jgi:hypothetical protein
MRAQSQIWEEVRSPEKWISFPSSQLRLDLSKPDRNDCEGIWDVCEEKRSERRGVCCLSADKILTGPDHEPEAVVRDSTISLAPRYT